MLRGYLPHHTPIMVASLDAMNVGEGSLLPRYCSRESGSARGQSLCDGGQ